ncbi:hypothetical protein GCM10009643_14020 [Microbacterium aurantiacum]
MIECPSGPSGDAKGSFWAWFWGFWGFWGFESVIALSFHRASRPSGDADAPDYVAAQSRSGVIR